MDIDAPRATQGWLFDLYPSSNGLTVWLMDGEGRKHYCTHPYTPVFYMHLAKSEERQLEALLPSLPCQVTLDHHIQIPAQFVEIIAGTALGG